MTGLDPLQLDLATAVIRMEQAYAEGDTALGGILVARLATCDAPRLRRYLTPEALAAIAEHDADRPPPATAWATVVALVVAYAGECCGCNAEQAIPPAFLDAVAVAEKRLPDLADKLAIMEYARTLPPASQEPAPADPV